MVVFAALGAAAAPFAFALADAPQDRPYDELVTVSGEVSGFFYKGCKDPENSTMIATAFVVDDVLVTFGPWWYWMHIGFNMTDFVEVGDDVRVTGEWEEREDGQKVLCAWHIENLTTDEELTIKEDGRPPWAGGPRALGIHPWPSSLVDE